MEVRFTKLSDARHAVAVIRHDGSTEQAELDSRSFLYHDFAHLAVEAELEPEHGFWGLVAEGAALAGIGLEGDGISLAETNLSDRYAPKSAAAMAKMLSASPTATK